MSRLLTEAVSKLIANDHKRIVFLTGPLTRDINRAKKLGYERALKEVGIELVEELIIEIENSYDTDMKVGATLKDYQLVTANICNE